ncbi:MAG TPA: hypothetical protein VIG51_03655 [Candidatus Baltobacteraceae bacterium]|jgi:hypothetical protein
MNMLIVRAEMPMPDPPGPGMPPQPGPGEPGLPEGPIIDPPIDPTQPM